MKRYLRFVMVGGGRATASLVEKRPTPLATGLLGSSPRRHRP